MKVLLDGDIIAFRTAASGEKEEFATVAYYTDMLINDIVEACRGDTFEVFVSGKNNFRYDIYPEYKANRDGAYVPKWREDTKQYLIQKYNAVVSEGCEADDLMGIAQCASGDDSVIASLDKDMLMIPGNHYSWEISGGTPEKRWTKPAIHRTVDHLSGLRWFYTQCITGDVADNIKGIPGRGIKFAENLLDPLDTEQDMFDAVRDAYGLDEAFLMNARCLWIFQQEEDDFIKRFNYLKGEDEDDNSREPTRD